MKNMNSYYIYNDVKTDNASTSAKAATDSSGSGSGSGDGDGGGDHRSGAACMHC
jgi:hypothetical protein